MKKAAFFLVALSISLIFCASMVKASSEATILPSADAYVAMLKPDVNEGADIYLYSYNWQNITNFTFMKFNFSSIPAQANITSIILEMRQAGLFTSTPATVGAFICDDNSWQESGITWNNAPASRSTPIGTVQIDTDNYGFGIVGTNYDFNLTEGLSGKSEVTLVLKKLNNSWSPDTFSSREGEYPPKLIVTYDMPSSLNTTLIAVAGVSIAVVAVAGLFTFRQRRKKNLGKQQAPPQNPVQPDKGNI
jgi:hypothetical protein